MRRFLSRPSKATDTGWQLSRRRPGRCLFTQTARSLWTSVQNDACRAGFAPENREFPPNRQLRNWHTGSLIPVA
jgi:hypothetical protein